MRAAICLLVAIVLLTGGLLTAKSCVTAVKENEVMLMGRKSSRLIRKEQLPTAFWISVGLNSMMAAGMFAVSAVLVVVAVRGRHKSPGAS